MGADPRDAVSLDEHAGVPPDARAVEEGHVCDVEGPRHLKTPTAERRRCHRPRGSASCRRASSRRSSRPRARLPPNGALIGRHDAGVPGRERRDLVAQVHVPPPAVTVNTSKWSWRCGGSPPPGGRSIWNSAASSAPRAGRRARSRRSRRSRRSGWSAARSTGMRTPLGRATPHHHRRRGARQPWLSPWSRPRVLTPRAARSSRASQGDGPRRSSR